VGAIAAVRAPSAPTAAAAAAPVGGTSAVADAANSASEVVRAATIASASGRSVWRYRGRAVEVSHDGGASWTSAGALAPARILAAFAVSDDLCWFVGEGGTALVVENGHARLIPFPASVDLRAVMASSGDSAIVTTSEGSRFRTSDGGQNWSAE
jgi:photosystem II stability/assembly factor-like uncharacterized protein